MRACSKTDRHTHTHTYIDPHTHPCQFDIYGDDINQRGQCEFPLRTSNNQSQSRSRYTYKSPYGRIWVCVCVSICVGFSVYLWALLKPLSCVSLMCSQLYLSFGTSITFYLWLARTAQQTDPKREQTAIRTGHKNCPRKNRHKASGKGEREGRKTQRNARLNTTLLLFMTPVDEKPNAKRLKADKIYLIAPICSNT